MSQLSMAAEADDLGAGMGGGGPGKPFQALVRLPVEVNQQQVKVLAWVISGERLHPRPLGTESGLDSGPDHQVLAQQPDPGWRSSVR
jgi:hypothetical protein